MIDRDLIAQISEAWTSRYKTVQLHGEQSREAGATFPTYEHVQELIRTEPNLAWSVILAVLDRTDDEFALENLAAGPLETLLGRHGSAFIERVEQRAAVDSKFRWLLGGVWQGTMRDEIWERVQEVASSE